MAAPLMAFKFDLDARAFALRDRAAEGLDQCFDVCEDDRRKRGPGEDCGERLAVSGIHGGMIAESAINGTPATLRCCL